MAEERNQEPGKKDEPPKIKLGLDKDIEELGRPPAESGGKSETARLDVSKAEPAAAPAHPGAPKKSTSRIDVSSAVPPPQKSTTTRIELSKAQPAAAKRSTTRIDPSQAQPPPKKGTTRIDPSLAAPPPGGPAGKAQTSRIELSKAMPPPETGATDIAAGIPHPGAAGKSRTIPPQPESDIKEEALKDLDIPAAAKQATQRIIIEEEAAPQDQTSRLETQALKSVAEVQESKKRTSRIDLPDTIEEKEADTLKRHTTPLPPTAGPPTTAPIVEPPAGQPKTIRIKRPGAPPTRVVARPPAEANVESPPSAQDVMEARKSETARLDLPPDVGQRPPTRPKTIRIKRPDGTTARKPLAIARAAGGAASVREEPSLSALGAMAEEEEVEEEGPGALFVALTTAALLVAAVLIYVLLSQTYAPTLPFPGRL